MMDTLAIREETVDDLPAIRQVNEAAFGRPEEAALVDALRAAGRVTLSLVALDAGQVAGHVLFSPVQIVMAGGISTPAVALAPLAVLPALQGRGIGSALTREGLARLRVGGHGIVIVLGHADYYPRFGFRPAAVLGIRAPWDVPEEAFMVAELIPGALEGVSGIVRYGPEFDAV